MYSRITFCLSLCLASIQVSGSFLTFAKQSEASMIDGSIDQSRQIPSTTYNNNENNQVQATSRSGHSELEDIHEAFKEHNDVNFRLYKIKNYPGNNITCNDGSQIGYYTRLNSHSKSWVIYLESGGFCSTKESCLKRWKQYPEMMSSNYWPQTRTANGILSNDPKDNPYLWNANYIYIPYCSSDVYSGFRPSGMLEYDDESMKRNSGAEFGGYSHRAYKRESPEPSFNFMGSKIIERVISSLFDDLPNDHSFYEAKSVLVAGESAGAIGVMLNLDKIHDTIDNRFQLYRQDCAQNLSKNCDPRRQAPAVRGLADSGWFVDDDPHIFKEDSFNQGDIGYDNNDHLAQFTSQGQSDVTPEGMVMQSMLLWNGQVPIECSSRHSSKPWLCYFGYRLHKTLRTPLFVVQWLYDEYQLMANNLFPPYGNAHWPYIKKYGERMRKSLENVTALFAPSCLSHTLITRPVWNSITVDGFKLPHVLNTWEEQSLSLSHGTSQSRVGSDNGRFQLINSPSSLLTMDTRRDNIDLYFTPFSSTNNREQVSTGQSNGERYLSFRSAYGRNQATNNVNSNRHRTNRKRRRNQLQSQKLRQTQTLNQANFQLDNTHSSNSEQLTDGSAWPQLDPQRDSLPVAESSGSTDLIIGKLTRNIGGRQGRSTSSIDDATLVLSNNVPDDERHLTSEMTNPQSISPSWLTSDLRGIQQQNIRGNKKHLTGRPTSIYNREKFRFIDSCAWPQCNRECPDDMHP